MPRNYLVANWKMNLPPEGLDGYFDVVNRAAATTDATVIVAPSFPFLREATTLATAVMIGAQNCSDQPAGALTGEVSASMIHKAGARHVLVGHSERRGLFGESDAMIARKLAQATGSALVPLLCIGEALSVRDAGGAADFLARQIEAVAAVIGEADTIVLAYEPIWAIGTGRTASPDVVAETAARIREALHDAWPAAVAASCPILYGGSVTPDNVAQLWGTRTINGFLVGGASLDSSKFSALLDGMSG